MYWKFCIQLLTSEFDQQKNKSLLFSEIPQQIQYELFF